MIGEQGLLSELAMKGFYPGEEEPLAVVVGLDPMITYENLSIASQFVRGGTPFVATNPDKTYPTPEGQAPGSGTFVAAVMAASDGQPVIIGKPEPEMYRIALGRMGLLAEPGSRGWRPSGNGYRWSAAAWMSLRPGVQRPVHPSPGSRLAARPGFYRRRSRKFVRRLMAANDQEIPVQPGSSGRRSKYDFRFRLR